MAVKLLRCSGQWVKIKGHPCWRVEKALKDMGIDYEAVHLPTGRGKRDQIQSLTGQSRYPAIQFEDGSVYREESKDMERTIRAGKLMQRAGAGSAAQTSG
jgi:glutaredoxin